MIFSFLAPAKNEFDEAIAYYEKQKPGLGWEFTQEVKATIQRIVNHPDAWAKLSDSVRRCRVKRFPYGVVYTRGGDGIIIVAIMHLHRKPGYWQDRIR